MLAEPLHVAGLAIEQVDLATLPEDDIVRLNAFNNLLREESNPDDPPTPVEITRARIRNVPAFVKPSVFFARDPDGSIAASAEAVIFDTDDNKHLVQAGISVRPDRRQRGIAKAMLRLIADVAVRENRRLIIGGTSERVPAGEAFAKRVGADAGLAEHINHLILAEVDRAMVDRWVEEGPGRAPGYSLVALDGPYPDELLDNIIKVHEIMNDAPRDDLDIEDFKMTPEHVRQWEKQMFATGNERWSLFARHDGSGELIGYTEVTWNPKIALHVWQQGTGVDPKHRGHALGKWLKAAMLQRVLDERPEATEIRTGNADSNDAMLGINEQLGFKPYQAHTAWQVGLETVQAYLGSSA